MMLVWTVLPTRSGHQVRSARLAHQVLPTRSGQHDTMGMVDPHDFLQIREGQGVPEDWIETGEPEGDEARKQGCTYCCPAQGKASEPGSSSRTGHEDEVSGAAGAAPADVGDLRRSRDRVRQSSFRLG